MLFLATEILRTPFPTHEQGFPPALPSTPSSDLTEQIREP